MKKITIFVLLPSFTNGGAEKVTLSLIQSLDNNIFNYFLVMQNTVGPLKTNISKNKIIDLKSLRFRNSLYKLVKKIFEKKPKVIFSTFPHMTIILLLIKKLFFLDFIIIAREPNMPSISLANAPYSYIFQKLYKITMPAVDGVIVSSSAMEKEIISKGIDQNKVIIIANPINLTKIRYTKNIYRQKGKGIRIVFVGRLVYQKGIDRLLPLLKYIPNIHLTIIGEGKEKEHLLKIIEEENIHAKVKFLGLLSNPYPYIAGADYFILPSRWEGFPNVVLESLALGTPVIAMKELSSLKDLKINILNKSINLFEKDRDVRNYLLNITPRNDFNKPILRPSLLENYNTPFSYSKKVTDFISKINDEK